ncbi:MAG TPA: ATP synthase F0 subunit B [Polyangiaceae bacterium]
MNELRLRCAFGVAVVSVTWSGLVLAQAEPNAAQPVAQPPAAQAEPAQAPTGTAHAPIEAATPPARAPESGATPEPPPAGPADNGNAVTGEHAGHASPHASGHEESHHPPTLDDVNWIYGLLGERDDGEPSLLYRPKGMPVPFLATLINWGILVGLIVMLAKKQLPAALAKRKATIVQGMDEAKKLRDESARRLHEYEDKLARIDNDIERIKDEMQRAGKQERDRILAEAVERRTRMERDARRLIETELEAVKETLRREVVDGALRDARNNIETQVASDDQQRLFDEAMASLKKLPPRSLGERA